MLSEFDCFGVSATRNRAAGGACLEIKMNSVRHQEIVIWWQEGIQSAGLQGNLDLGLCMDKKFL